MLPFAIKSNSKAREVVKVHSPLKGTRPREVVFRDGPVQGPLWAALVASPFPSGVLLIALKLQVHPWWEMMVPWQTEARTEPAGQPGSEHEPHFLASRATAQGKQGLGSPCPGLRVSVKYLYLEVSGTGDRRLPLQGNLYMGCICCRP